MTLVLSASGYWTSYELDYAGRSPRALSFALGVLFCVPGIVWMLILSRWREAAPDALAQPLQAASGEDRKSVV